MFKGLRESEDDMSAVQQKEHMKQTFSKAATVYSNNPKINNYEQNYCITSGFWPRVRARALRAPVFLGSLIRQMGRCGPPPSSSQLCCSLKNKK